jgi:hypothetical protein
MYRQARTMTIVVKRTEMIDQTKIIKMTRKKIKRKERKRGKVTKIAMTIPPRTVIRMREKIKGKKVRQENIGLAAVVRIAPLLATPENLTIEKSQIKILTFLKIWIYQKINSFASGSYCLRRTPQ